MGSLLYCMKQLGIDESDPAYAEYLAGQADKHQKAGMTEPEAHHTAVADALRDGRKQQQAILKQVHDATPESDRHKIFPAIEPPKPKDERTPEQKFVAAMEDRMTEKTFGEKDIVTLTGDQAESFLGRGRAKNLMETTVAKKVKGQAPDMTIVTENASVKEGEPGPTGLFGKNRAGVVLEHFETKDGKKTLLLSTTDLVDDSRTIEELATKALGEAAAQKKNLYLSKEARATAIGEYYDEAGLLGGPDKGGRTIVRQPAPSDLESGLDDGKLALFSGIPIPEITKGLRELMGSDAEGNFKDLKTRARDIMKGVPDLTPALLRRAITYMHLPEAKRIAELLIEKIDPKHNGILAREFMNPLMDHRFRVDGNKTGEQISRSIVDKSDPSGEFYRKLFNRALDLMHTYGIEVGVVGKDDPRFSSDAEAKKLLAFTNKLLDERHNGATNRKLEKLLEAAPQEYKDLFNKIVSKKGSPYQRIKEVNGIAFDHLNAYLPRIMKSDIAKQISEDLRGVVDQLNKGKFEDKAVAKMLEGKSEVTTKYIKHLLDTKQAKNYGDAVRLLERRAYDDLIPQSSFEKKRVLDLPSDAYETDADAIMPIYFNVISKRIAQAQVVGPKGELFTSLLMKIRAQDPREAAIAQTAIDISTGRFERDIRGKSKVFATKVGRAGIDAFMAAETATKIGLGLATIPNVTQTVTSTMSVLGVGNYFRGALELFGNYKERSKYLSDTGVINPEILWSTLGYKTSGPLGDVTRKLLKWSGFEGINKINALLAASTFDVAVKDWYKAAKQGDTMAKLQLKRFGIDPNKTLTQAQLGERIFRFAIDNQLQGNFLQDPIYAHDPRFRPLYLFKRFGLRQFTYIKDQAKWSWENGDKMFFLRLAAGGFLGGELVVFAKNKIKWLLSGKDEDRPEDLISIDRMLNNFAAVGSLGILTDMTGSFTGASRWSPGGATAGGAIGATVGGLTGGSTGAVLGGTAGALLGSRYERLGKSAKRAITPVVFSDVERMIDAYTRTMEDWKNYGDGFLTMRRGTVRALPMFGAIPGSLAERLKTDAQMKAEADQQRGQAVRPILDKIIDGEKASEDIQAWNDANPNNPIKPKDISVTRINQRRRDRAKVSQDAMTWPGLQGVTVK